MKPQQTITSIPVSPDEDRKRRMVQYTVAMSIRLVCVIAVFFVHGWWAVLPIIGAVFLPSIAVILANNIGSSRSSSHEKPPTRVVVVSEPVVVRDPRNEAP
jgi:hypothetical protein